MAIAAGYPTAFILAGPNGAGKSTFYETVLQRRVAAPFINADMIQREELEDASMKASYEAARIAEERRQEHVRRGSSFVMETVFSHPSKLEFVRQARASGFRIILFHLNVRDADLAVARVKARHEEGGHDVPEDKVRGRYTRNQALIRDAALLADRALVFDSSALNERPQVLVELRNGRVVKRAEEMPEWCEELYGQVE